MFENLSSKLETVFKKLRGHGKLTQENIQEALKEVCAWPSWRPTSILR